MVVLRLVSSFLALSSALVLATACDGESGGGDGGTALDAGTPDATLIDPNCEPGVAANGNGMHNAGRNCITSGCHDGAGRPPQWTIAGTLYADATGSGILPGATIVITDANGTEIKLVTAANGNFYTGQAVTFPVSAKASLCPNSLSEPMMLEESMGGCNQAGCHDLSGRRIYLPQ